MNSKLLWISSLCVALGCGLPDEEHDAPAQVSRAAIDEGAWLTPSIQGVAQVTVNGRRCSGALLTRELVLTSTTCITTQVASITVSLEAETRSVSEVRPHGNLGLGLLKLTSPFLTVNAGFSRSLGTSVPAVSAQLICQGFGHAPGASGLESGTFVVSRSTTAELTLKPVGGFAPAHFAPGDEGAPCLLPNTTTIAAFVSATSSGQATAVPASNLATFITMSTTTWGQTPVTVRSVSSGECIAATSGTALIERPCSTTDSNQAWWMISTTWTRRVFQNIGSGECMVADNAWHLTKGSCTSGSAMVMVVSPGFNVGSPGTTMRPSLNLGAACVDVPWGWTGQTLQTYPCNGGSNQLFTVSATAF
jgi:hypothetical protein